MGGNKGVLDDSPIVYQLASRIGQSDVLEWIEERAQCFAELGRTSDGTVEVGRALRRACGVEAIVPGSTSARAELRSEDGRYCIVFNPVFSPDVQRFSIAHEIGHTLWMEGTCDKVTRNLCSTTGLNDETIELLCDYFAAALLMPRADIGQIVQRHCDSRSLGHSLFEAERFPLELVPTLARRFRVQRRIAAWRLLGLQGLSSWVVIRVRNRRGGIGFLPFWDGESGAETWEASWYATGGMRRRLLTVEGYSVPFDGRRRKIPRDMIPRDLSAEGRVYALDSRWWDGVKPAPDVRARIPMSRRAAGSAGRGLAARIEDSVYIALDREAIQTFAERV